MSQGAFAGAVGGISQQQVSDWECGKGLRAMAITIRVLSLIEEAESENRRRAPRSRT